MFAQLPVGEMARLARKLDRVGELPGDAGTRSSKATARSWRWAIDARVAKRAARLAAAMADAGALYSARTAARGTHRGEEAALCGGAVDARRPANASAADLRVLKRAQELLGRMHDVQMLIDQVRQTQASLTPPSVTVWRELDTLVASLEDDCRRLHARYMRNREALAAVAERRSEPIPAPVGRAQAQRAG